MKKILNPKIIYVDKQYLLNNNYNDDNKIKRLQKYHRFYCEYCFKSCKFICCIKNKLNLNVKFICRKCRDDN